MPRIMDLGKGDPIPGREEILAGKQEGWERFCTFCVEFLTVTLSRYHFFKWEETPKQIALGVTTKVFFAFNNKPETLANINTAEEIMSYLRRAAWIYRKAEAIVQKMLANKPMTPEEAEEADAKARIGKPKILGIASLDIERATTARELLPLIVKARGKLSPKRREALDRAAWGDSQKMIAQALGMKDEKAVGRELDRARQDLLKNLPEDSISALEIFVPRQIRKLRGEKRGSKQAGTFQVPALAS